MRVRVHMTMRNGPDAGHSGHRGRALTVWQRRFAYFFSSTSSGTALVIVHWSTMAGLPALISEISMRA